MKNGKSHISGPDCPELDRLVLDEFEALQRSTNRSRGGLQAKQASLADEGRPGKAKADVAYLKDHRRRPSAASAQPDSMALDELLSSCEEEAQVPSDDALQESDASSEGQPEASLFTAEEERFLGQVMARLKSMANKDMLMSELWRRVTASETDFFAPDPPAARETEEPQGEEPQD